MYHVCFSEVSCLHTVSLFCSILISDCNRCIVFCMNSLFYYFYLCYCKILQKLQHGGSLIKLVGFIRNMFNFQSILCKSKLARVKIFLTPIKLTKYIYSLSLPSTGKQYKYIFQRNNSSRHFTVIEYTAKVSHNTFHCIRGLNICFGGFSKTKNTKWFCRQ